MAKIPGVTSPATEAKENGHAPNQADKPANKPLGIKYTYRVTLKLQSAT